MDKLTPKVIVEKFGGGSKLANLLGCEPSAISNWLARGRIPIIRWADLLHLAEQEGVTGITFDALRAAHAYPVGRTKDANTPAAHATENA